MIRVEQAMVEEFSYSRHSVGVRSNAGFERRMDLDLNSMQNHSNLNVQISNARCKSSFKPKIAKSWLKKLLCKLFCILNR